MSERWVNGVRDPNPRYCLTASLGLTTLRLRFDADDDTAAVMYSIREILDRAAMEQDFAFDQQFWSKGEITLTNPAGAIIESMPLKRAQA
jgi:hypothetical protein